MPSQSKSNAKIYFFLASQAVSLIGSSLVQYAVMWSITLQQNSGAVLTTYMLFTMVPAILLSFISGIWADRYNRKKLIILADGGIALATLVLFFIIQGGNTSLFPIYAIAAVRSFGGAVQTPAVNAFIPQLCPPDKLVRVNSINGTINSIVMLVTPAAAAALLPLGLPIILLIDVVTASLAIFILFFIKTEPVATAQGISSNSSPHFFSDLAQGLSYTGKHFFVRTMLLFSLLANLFITPVSVFNTLVTIRFYGNSTALLSLVEILFSVGTLAGGIALSIWGGFRNRMFTLFASSTLSALCTLLFSFTPSFPLYAVGMFLFGLAIPGISSVPMAMLQEKTDSAFMGRVMSVFSIVGMGVTLASTLFFGPLIDRIPIEWAVLASAIAMLVLSLCGFAYKRFVKEGLPPAPALADTEPSIS